MTAREERIDLANRRAKVVEVITHALVLLALEAVRLGLSQVAAEVGA